MPADGYLQVHVYTSDALLPLEGAAIAVLRTDGILIATRLTNKDGRITPIGIPAPEEADSRTPDFVGQPFTTVRIHAQHPGYEQIQVNEAQIFGGITTLQPLAMVPTALYPERLDGTEYFNVPPQNL